MYIDIPCSKCLNNSNKPNIHYTEVEICDNGIYKTTCDQGHETIMLMLNEKFEVLFDMGVFALMDGYTREAVSNYAASLERFYEYCIKVFIKKSEIANDEYQNIWKLVKNQSERQLGAFYFLYLNNLKKVPRTIKDIKIEFSKETNAKDPVEFRNNIIHKGYIPKKSDVILYADALLKYMYDILKELRALYEKEIHLISMEKKESLNIIAEKFKDKSDKDLNLIEINYYNSIINMAEPDDFFGKYGLEEALAYKKKERNALNILKTIIN